MMKPRHEKERATSSTKRGALLPGLMVLALLLGPVLPPGSALPANPSGLGGIDAASFENWAAFAASEQVRLNLGLVDEILAILDGPEQDELLQGVAVAKRATYWQAITLGVPWVEPVPLIGYDRPSAAVMELASRYGMVLDSEQLEILADLDDLESDLARALARFVDAFLAMDTAARVAYAGADLEKLQSLLEELDRDDGSELTSLLATLGVDATQGPRAVFQDLGIDFILVFPTRNQFIDAIVDLDTALRVAGPQPLPVHGHGHTSFCPAFAYDLTGVNSFYQNDCALVLDVGGSDKYHNNAGGGSSLALLPAAAAVSLGLVSSGSNQYGDSSSPRSGANGGGNGGVGFLFDSRGRPHVYTARTGNGGGGLGTGFLFDLSGGDSYAAGSAGNGAGVLGLGLLIDMAGYDRYLGSSNKGTNGAGQAGIGLLLDASGGDLYSAPLTSCVTNGGSGGGVGFLLDLYGDNQFLAPNCLRANGGSWGGTGMLLTLHGDNYYKDAVVECWNCNALLKGGSGIFLGTGFQLDWGI